MHSNLPIPPSALSSSVQPSTVPGLSTLLGHLGRRYGIRLVILVITALALAIVPATHAIAAVVF